MPFLIKVNGLSMFPWLIPGIVAEVYLCGQAELQPGEIAVFKKDGRFICHRFFSREIEHSRVWLKVKGDISPTFDPLIASTAVLGKVTRLKLFGISLRLDCPAARRLGLLLSRIMPACCLLLKGKSCRLIPLTLTHK